MSNDRRYPLQDIVKLQNHNETVDDKIIRLRAFLRRFTKSQLLKEVLEINNLSESFSEGSHARRLDKSQLINYVIHLAEEANFDLDEWYVQLELKYCQLHTNSRKWNALEIKEAKTHIEENTEPKKLAKKLMKYLKRSHLFCKVKSEFYDGAVWTVIAITQRNMKSHHIYFVTFVQMSVVIHSSIQIRFQDTINRAIIQLFRGSGINKLAIQSKNIETLLVYSSKRFKTSLPQTVHLEEKPLTEDEEEELSSNIVCEDKIEERERKLYALDTFGSFRGPSIEHLSYNVISEFFEDYCDENTPPTVTNSVVLKGKNVLEGIRQLVKNGNTAFPLPEYMTPKGARKYGDKFMLETKRLRTN